MADPNDAGSVVPDAGERADAGRLDDAGLQDAGRVNDAGQERDAGHDAGNPVTDAGHDAGSPGDAGEPASRVTARPLGSTTANAGFYEYLPPGYDGRTPVPLLIFRHGSGENGNGTTNLPNVLKNGNPVQQALNNKWPNSRPFIILAPQHSGGGSCPGGAEVHDFLTWALAHYAVDPKQVYLTGLSCGAIGAWSYFGTYTDSVVAAAVLLSGADLGGAWGQQGCKLANVAVWAFHGDADNVISFSADLTLNNDLKACPQPPRRDIVFTRIVGGGHGPWNQIYDLSAGYGDIYAWLLAHHKP